MREKDLSITLLLDFYGEVLTDKQREVIRLYYDDDLSLAEIAEQEDITRQGVRDSIKRGEATLREMEEKLRLVQRFAEQRAVLEAIVSAAGRICEINDRFCVSREIGALAEQIKDAAAGLCE